MNRSSKLVRSLLSAESMLLYFKGWMYRCSSTYDGVMSWWHHRKLKMHFILHHRTSVVYLHDGAADWKFQFTAAAHHREEYHTAHCYPGKRAQFKVGFYWTHITFVLSLNWKIESRTIIRLCMLATLLNLGLEFQWIDPVVEWAYETIRHCFCFQSFFPFFFYCGEIHRT